MTPPDLPAADGGALPAAQFLARGYDLRGKSLTSFFYS